jgi:hypothetical protein
MTAEHEWSPYMPDGKRTVLVDESCCGGRIRLLQEGGAHVVVARRRPYSLRADETARGAGATARDVFRELVEQHLAETRMHTL